MIYAVFPNLEELAMRIVAPADIASRAVMIFLPIPSVSSADRALEVSGASLEIFSVFPNRLRLSMQMGVPLRLIVHFSYSE